MQYITTPHEAELNAANKMREWGYLDAVATTGGADGGIDVRSNHALAQVKWRGGVVGRPDLQRLYGARSGDVTKELIFFSASGYSSAAVAYARQADIRLFIYDPVGSVTPVVGSEPNAPPMRARSLDSSALLFWLVVLVGLVLSAGLLVAVATR